MPRAPLHSHPHARTASATARLALPTHRDEFPRVYDLDDPSPYFTALTPSGYCLPQVLARTVRAIHRTVAAARGAERARLRLLDFACGYGPVGALLRHDLTMDALYARYREREWRPTDGRRHWSADAAFFAARRRRCTAFEIGGIDIAATALEYAAALGFVDRTFHDDLARRAPGDALARFLDATDLVVESGASTVARPSAFARILDTTAARPWFLFCPRLDADPAPLDALWAERGYCAERVSHTPILYRKPLTADERADMLRAARALGRHEHEVMRDGYLLAEVTLARPAADPASVAVETLRAGLNG